jgi:gamma-glutamyltranspeptidase/glutathione hydrolase
MTPRSFFSTPVVATLPAWWAGAPRRGGAVWSVAARAPLRGAVNLLILGLSLALAAQPPPDDAELFAEPGAPPAEQPKPTYARQAMVAAAQPLAARAGVEIMKRGGTAIDAAVAVQFVLNVVEPQSSGLGGGCFILYYEAARPAVHGIDGREETPRGARRENFLDDQGKVRKDALVGGAAVGVPGCLAAMYFAHERFGKLPWAELFQPAIHLAEGGHGVTPRFRMAIDANRERFLRMPSSAALFLRPDGATPEIGDLLKNPDLARTLRLIAAQGPPVFYEGELARMVVAAVRQAPLYPGSLSMDDMRGYRAIIRETVRSRHGTYEIVGMPPPSSGTLSLGEILDLVSTLEPHQRRPGSAAAIDAFARAESVAFADRNAYLGDPAFSDVPMLKMLEPARLAERRQVFAALKPGQRAKPGGLPGAPGEPGAAELNPLEGGNTTHFSIVDPYGNVLALTTTIEHGMGCGLVVPGGGFLLNNQLTDFDLDKTSGPNALENRRVPRPGGGDMGKRPRSSMTPIIVFKDGKPYATLGSPGGSQIIGIVAETLIGLLDHDLDMQAAINLPRSSCRNRGKLKLEAHHPNRVQLVKELEALGWPVEAITRGYEAWGGAHGIRLLPDGRLEGGADPRREGAVRGY